MNDASTPLLPFYFPEENSTLHKISAERGDRPHSLYVGRFSKSRGYSVIARDAPLIFTICELVPDRKVHSYIADRNKVDEVMRSEGLPPHAADLIITFGSGLTEWWKVYRDDDSSLSDPVYAHCRRTAQEKGIEYKTRRLKELRAWEIKFENWLRLNRFICVTEQLTGWAELMPSIDGRLRLHGNLTIEELLALYPGDDSVTLGAIARLIQRGHVRVELETRLITRRTILQYGDEPTPDVLSIQRESANEQFAQSAVKVDSPSSDGGECKRGRPRSVTRNQPSINHWPVPNENLIGDLETQEDYRLRKRAVILYANGADAETILSETGISIDRTRDLYKRCIVVKDNQMEGFYGLIPYRRQKEYVRVAPVAPLRSMKTSGTAGAFQQFLRGDKKIREFFESYVVPPGAELPRPYGTVRQIHHEMIEWLKTQGKDDSSAYPFSRDSLGYRSVLRHVRALQYKHGVEMVGKKPQKYGPTTGTGYQRLIKPHGPCSFLQLDYQEVPAASILVVSNDYGQEFELPIQRFSIAYVACESTEAIMGVGIEFEVQPSVDSALEAINSAICPDDDWLYEGKLRFTQHGKFLLRHFIPELAWEGWLVLRLDNALCNKAHDLVNNVVDTVGCILHYGRARGYWLRDVIERTIGQLQERGLVRLSSSYGSGLKDRRRDEPEAKAIESRIRLEDITAVLYAVIEAHNLMRSQTNQMSSRVEAVQAVIANPEFGFLSQPIPRGGRTDYRLLSHAEDRTISGNPKDGVYIPLGPLRYQNVQIARNFALRGQEVRIYVDRRDSRVARAFVKQSGEDLGVLVVRGGWHKWRLSWRHRQLLLKAGASPRDLPHDPVAKLREEAIAAQGERKRQGKKAGSKKATQLAQMELAQLRGRSPYAETATAVNASGADNSPGGRTERQATTESPGSVPTERAESSDGAGEAHSLGALPTSPSGGATKQSENSRRKHRAVDEGRQPDHGTLPGSSFGLNRVPRKGGLQ